MPGSPDIAITKYKIAIFVDGEFWHGYNWEEKKTKIKNHRVYWISKIENNMKRDQRNNAELKNMGWIVLRFWSKMVLKHTDYCVEIIKFEIKGQKDN